MITLQESSDLYRRIWAYGLEMKDGPDSAEAENAKAELTRFIDTITEPSAPEHVVTVARYFKTADMSASERDSYYDRMEAAFGEDWKKAMFEVGQ